MGYGGLLGAQPGAADSGTDTSLAHAGQGWTADQWTGGIVSFTSGDNDGQFRRIVASDTESVFWDLPLPTPAAAGDLYNLAKQTVSDAT